MVLTYIVRRLIGAVVLLVIVSAVVFSIFFLVPRLGGASADDLAGRYVGKSAGSEQIHQTAVRLGFTDPLYVQYGRFAKGIVAGQDYDYGPAVEHCPAPCLGYSFITQNPVLPDLLDRLPVTLSLAVGASVLWLVGGVTTGVISALRRGSFLDRSSMSVALAGVSLPIFFTGCSRSPSSATDWAGPPPVAPTPWTPPAPWTGRTG
jgi:peptide/nickel transport system permease protein